MPKMALIIGIKTLVLINGRFSLLTPYLDKIFHNYHYYRPQINLRNEEVKWLHNYPRP